MSRFKVTRMSRSLGTESLEHRVLLDAGLGEAFVQFADAEELQTQLVQQAVDRHQGVFGTTYTDQWLWWGGGCGDLSCVSLDFAAPPMANVGDAVLRGDFSDTNTQVAGVDEGDVIETDGEFVYLISNNQLSIVDIRTPEHPRVASRYELDDGSYANEIYLDDTRLTIVSTAWNNSYIDDGIGIFNDAIDIDVVRPGFRCCVDPFFAPSQPEVIATVIDVTDREEPWMVKRTEIDGSLTNSRTIDGTTYLMVEDYMSFPQPTFELVEPELKEGQELPEFNTYQYESEEDYRARITPLVLDVLPEYRTYDSNGNEVMSGLISEATEIFKAEGPTAQSALSVVTVDMHVDEAELKSATTVLAASGHEIFMSTNSLYLFQPTWGAEDETKIVKFGVDVDEGTVDPVAIGTVPGRMLNQFSADEMHGQLRIATTSGWGRESSSGVYILDETDSGDLEIVGSVDNMAPGESIFSVRFVNYTGYVVTFERVDPLFTLDLTDPTNPQVEGELKITGFSQQLIPLDETHLIGIGRDATDQGVVGNIQVSLFDVSDSTDPQLMDKYTFRGNGHMWSQAEYDHHAIGYYPEFNTLAFPVSQQGRPAAWITVDGKNVFRPAERDYNMQVFQIDVENGIEHIGAVAHPSEVQRSVRVGEALITTSRDTVKVSSMADPEAVVGQVHFAPVLPLAGNPIPEPLNAGDIDELFIGIAAGSRAVELDLDGNAVVDQDDIDFAVNAVLRTDYGDTNLDGRVDFDDFLKLSANFGQEGGWAEGDFNGDGLVDFADFSLLSENFNA